MACARPEAPSNGENNWPGDNERSKHNPMTDLDRHFLIAAGTSDYLYVPPLLHVRDDLDTVSELFCAMGYGEANTRGIFNASSADQLKSKIGMWMRQEDRREDTIVMYYSGHGERDDLARHYLLCTNSEPNGLADTALATEDVIRIVTSAGVRRLLLIIDTCQAGLAGIDSVRLAAKRLGAEFASAPGAPVDRLVAFSVIAAARTREDADDGVFADALNAAISDKTLGGSRQQYLFVQQVVDRINEEFSSKGTLQHATSATLCHEPGRGFLLNPRYIPDLPQGRLDVAETQAWDTVNARRRRAEALIHFAPRGRGTETSADVGHYFTGRIAVLSRLAAWLRGSSDTDVRAMLITGSAGTGKSAVIGRLVTRADQNLRWTIPDSSVPISTDLPPNIIDVAIHARRLQLADVVGGIAEAVGMQASTEHEVLEALSRREKGMTIAIDALDEAGSVWDNSHAQRIAFFLAELVRENPNVKVIIGARPHMRQYFGRNVEVIDLDDSKWITYHDLSEYAELLLRHPHGVGSASAYGDKSAHKVGAIVSERSYPNYLITRLTARALAMNKRPLDTSKAGWDTTIPSLTGPTDKLIDQIGQAFRWALETHLQDQATHVRDLLRPLAYSEGDGLPAHAIWSAVASALCGRDVTDGDISQLIGDAAPYLIESLDEYGRSVYRLYHQGLADDLRRDAPLDADERIARALIALVPLDTNSNHADWAKADPYIISHLATHAAVVGLLDQLVLDSEYLVHADPRDLIEHLKDLHTPAGQRIAAVYRTSAHLYTDSDVAERRRLLLIDAARHRNKALTNSLVSSLRRTGYDWVPLWATGSQISPSLMTTISHHIRPIHAIACTTLDGKSLAVTGDRDGVIFVSDLNTGKPIRRIESGQLGGVCAISCTRIRDRMLAVTGGWDGSVRIWDLRAGSALTDRVMGHDSVVSLSCTSLNNEHVIVSGGADGLMRIWSIRITADALELNEMGDPICASQPGMMGGYSVILGGVSAIACARVKSRVVVAAGDSRGYIEVWDLRARERLYSINRSHSDSIFGAIRALACFRFNGLNILASSGDNGIIEFWDLATGDRVLEPINSHPAKMSAGILGLAYYRVGKVPIVVACGGNGMIRAWEIIQGTEVGKPLVGHFRAVRAVCTATRDGGNVVVTAGDDHLVRVWRATASRRKERFVGHTGVIHQATRTLDGRDSLIGTMAYDGMVILRTMKDGAPFGYLAHRGGEIDAVTFATMNGRNIAVTGSSDATIRIWDLEGVKQIGRPLLVSGHRGRDAELSTVKVITCTSLEGRLVAVTGGSDGTVRLWDLEARTQMGRSLVAHEGFVTGLACARVRGANIVISGGMDGTFQVWDLQRQKRIGQPVRINDSWVSSMCCISREDADYLVLGGNLGTLEVWKLLDRSLLGRAPLHAGDITSVISWPHFDGAAAGWREGSYIATSGVDGYVHILAPWTGGIRTLSFPASVGSLVACPSGRLLVCFGWDAALLGRQSTEREIRFLDLIFARAIQTNEH
jgi:WD40 repeat protein